MRKLLNNFFIYFLLFFFHTILFGQSTIPLPEHPRPDFNRSNWKNLNGIWEFRFDQNDIGLNENWSSGKINFDKKIKVPFPWGSELSQVKDEANIGWYSRNINVPSDWKNKNTFITIGASDWETTLWLDGELIGKHRGGYVPFSFNLTPYLKYDSDQKIVIRVDDDAGDPSKFKRGHALYGKQGYGNARGIWQTVYLEARGKDYIDAVHFNPDIDNRKVNVTVYLNSDSEDVIPLSLKIKTENDFLYHNLNIKPGQQIKKFDIEIPNMRLWSLDDPYLYDVEVALGDDIVQTYFGMRKISTEMLPGTDYPYVALNNEPIYLQMALDQSYHPEGFYTFPNDNFIKEEILLSKSIGLNGIRIHIKTEVPRKLYWADKLGLLVVQDLPNSWGQPDKLMKDEIKYSLEQMIKRDYNHPSIISWVIFNEQWGLYTKNDSEDNKENKDEILPETYNWVASMYYYAKSLDQSRLIEDNSPCCGGLHTATDINSWHNYLPGYEWENYLKEQSEKNFKGGSHLYYKGFNQDNQPFMNSECGNVWGYEGSTGDIDWSYDYHKMINSFRMFPEVAGWVYTEHHDVINEWNGYWKFDRSEKFTGVEEIFDGMTLNDFHSPVYLSTGGEISQTVNSEESIEIPLFISSMTSEDFGKELVIDYELSHINYIAQKSILHSNQIKIDYNPWVQKSLPSLKLTMAKVSGLSKLTLALKTIQGEVLHRNFMHFEVISGEELKNAVVFDTNVKSFSNSSWSNKSWLVFDGKKANGTGSGFFEYEIAIPKEIKVQNHKEAFFIAELSSKEFFDKDKDDIIIEDGLDYMKGSLQSPSINPNSYPMTDTKRFQSKIDIYVNDKFKQDVTLNDDPADHRGVLSWHNQVRSELGSVKLEEAGSYGYLVKIPISHEELENSIKNGKIKIKFKTKGKNGIAIYGKSFGRYPINPSLVILN